MKAVSILEEYNTNHIGKLDEYIKLHVFGSIPGSGLNWTFREDWGVLVDIHPNSLPLGCPNMIFKMMSTLVHPGSIGSVLREYDGVDSRALYLHCPVSRDDVDHSTAYASRYPMLSGSLGVDTTALSLRFPFPGMTLTIAPMQSALPVRVILKGTWEICFLQWLGVLEGDGKKWTRTCFTRILIFFVAVTTPCLLVRIFIRWRSSFILCSCLQLYLLIDLSCSLIQAAQSTVCNNTIHFSSYSCPT